jgi:hypothetical protein
MKDVHAKHAYDNDEPTNNYKHGSIVTGKIGVSKVQERYFYRLTLSDRPCSLALGFRVKASLALAGTAQAATVTIAR